MQKVILVKKLFYLFFNPWIEEEKGMSLKNNEGEIKLLTRHIPTTKTNNLDADYLYLF